MNRRLMILLSLAACAASTGAQATDQLRDYAWRITVQPAAGGVARLPLPKEVYLHARTSSLADLRLFDANGKALAFAIGAPAVQSNTEQRELPVRVFPLTGASASSESLQNVEIRTASDGRLLSVSVRSRPGAQADALQALILDLGRQDQHSRIAGLRFTLPGDIGNYSAQVLLEVSDDLKQWDAIGTTTLNWLRNSDTQTLANDSMDFAPRSFRYARLSWQDGQPLAFAGISAQAVSQASVAPPRASITLQGKAGKDASQWLYATPPAIPADSIGLQLDQPDTVLPVTLGVLRQAEQLTQRHRLYRHHGQTRPQQGSYIDPLLNTTFYRISHAGNGGKERVSGDLSMPVVQTTQWVLQGGASSNLVKAPALRLGWTPETLFFLASGKPPYQLAFGNGKATPAATSLSQVAPGFQPTELLALPAATTGVLTAQTGAPAAAPASADTARPWRLAALWGALLLGVAVLGFFAWRLLTQMKQEQEQEEQEQKPAQEQEQARDRQ